MSNSDCILCGSADSRTIFRDAPNLPGKFLNKCNNCKIVFQSPWENDFSPELYEYYKERIGKSRSNLYSSLNEKRYAALLDCFKQVTKGRHILDLGCGEGHFVSAALKLGWDACGIELSPGAFAICKEFGLPVQDKDIYSSQWQGKKFDAITLFEVVEHLADPVKLIKRAEELLNPSGILYLTTPNYDSLDRRLIGKDWRVIHREHLVYFTPKTLRTLIERHTGLKVARLNSKNISGELLSLFCKNRSKDKISKPEADAKKGARVQEQIVRNQLENNPSFNLAKDFLNAFLNFSNLGSTIQLMCVKK